jgi:hypothetical protein
MGTIKYSLDKWYIQMAITNNWYEKSLKFINSFCQWKTMRRKCLKFFLRSNVNWRKKVFPVFSFLFFTSIFATEKECWWKRDRECVRERESVWRREREGGRYRVREIYRDWERVCVWERERERERGRERWFWSFIGKRVIACWKEC